MKMRPDMARIMVLMERLMLWMKKLRPLRKVSRVRRLTLVYPSAEMVL